MQFRLPFEGGRRPRRPFQIGRRVRVEVVFDPVPGEPQFVSSPAEVYALLGSEAEAWDRERFLTILVDVKHRILGIEEVSVGSLNSSIVHPREVLKAIILSNAAGFICVHNHPSGDPTPSREDMEITRRLREAADLLGVRLHDHIVIGRGRFVSFVEDGYW